jgi:hypothetical protein
MSFDFLDLKSVYEHELESIVGDDTIGLLQASGETRGHVMFDVHRLREAIIAYEREFDEESVEIALFEHPEVDDGAALLAFVPRNGSDRAVVLAPRVEKDGEYQTGADELIQGGESA